MSLLEVRDLKKSFGDLQVLKGISFTLEKGGVLAIIGSSGSGKTTLLRCLNFLEQPDSGQIIVNGESLMDETLPKKKKERNIREKRLHFGLVFQQFNLFPHYNVLSNVKLAPTLLATERAKKQKLSKTEQKAILAEVEEQAKATIEKVGLTEKLDAYPCQLSGGQQQRVAIARALALNPDILCFDEPTSALDPELTGEVLKVIRELKSADSTMIVVTHEMEFARDVADTVIYMANGVIEEIGTPEQVFGSPTSPKLIAFLAGYHNDGDKGDEVF